MAKIKKSNKIKNKSKKIIKYCPICGKPHSSKKKMCVICNRKALNLKNYIPHLKYNVTIERLVWLKHKHKVSNIFDFLEKNPHLYFDNSQSYERKMLKYDIANNLVKTTTNPNFKKYHKYECDIPPYIFTELKKHKTKELITIDGNVKNPNIYYKCLKCNEDQMQTYQEIKFKKGHDCICNKSSGEIIVENYLKQYFNIKTQYDTFKCINPKTNYQLPYDIEIPEKKILIEIQGKQHYEFTPYFHGTISNFEYQKRKDSYKKRYAEKYGYKVIYIDYDEIENETYKEKIKSLF